MQLKRYVTFRVLFTTIVGVVSLQAQSSNALVPMLKSGQPVDWWFVFKFNTASLPSCRASAPRACIFGGQVQPYKFSQQFAYASSADPTLKQGSGCVGDTQTDPVGATFEQVYAGNAFYVLWNDEFYGDLVETKGAPWGHSKGMLAWNQDGSGFVMQVSTPSWPVLSGSAVLPRKTGRQYSRMHSRR